MRRRSHSVKRAALSFLCIVLAIILTVMLSVTLYFRHLLGSINYIDPDDIFTLSQAELDAFLSGEPEDPNADAPSMDAGDVEFGEHGTQIGGKGSDLVNILLIGQDRREGEGRARSDTMILCTFNKSTKTLTLTSFLRDLYVEIPGYKDNRINASYAAGGMSLLNATLEHNFGIHVDGNVEVDFNQFAKIVDLLGGVTIELQQNEANEINSTASGTVYSGPQLLNGEQALAYARIRRLDADGDFSRTSRQRKVINALLESYKSASLSKVLSLLDDILPMITTDLSDARIIAYATELFPMLSDATIVSQRIPADGHYAGRMINGMSVLVADMEASRQLLEDTLLN